jgi:hypothetical protein
MQAAAGHHRGAIDPATGHNAGLVRGESCHRPTVTDPLRGCYAFPQYGWVNTTNFIDLVA